MPTSQSRNPSMTPFRVGAAGPAAHAGPASTTRAALAVSAAAAAPANNRRPVRVRVVGLPVVRVGAARLSLAGLRPAGTSLRGADRVRFVGSLPL